MKLAKTAYVEHPVSRDEKEKLNGEGFKVVDIRFKPAEIGKDDKVIQKPKAKK